MGDYEVTVENNIITMPDLNYVPNSNGLGYELFECMKKYKSKIVQIHDETGETDTYENLLRRCIRTAIELKARNITSNDIVCVCTYNHLNACVPYIAALFIGAKVCALDPSIDFSESKYLLSLVNPKIIFVVSEKLEMYKNILKDLSIESKLVTFDSTGEDSIQRFLGESSEENSFLPEKVKNINDTAIIVFSSGTTGLAKGLCLSNGVLLSQAKNFRLCGFNDGTSLTIATLYWISSIILLVQTIMGGTTKIITTSLSPLDAWHNLSKYKVTMMFSSPTQVMAMLKVGRPEGIDTSNLHDVFIGGGAISAENIWAIRDLLPGTHVFSVYGLTEVAGPATMFRPISRQDIIALEKKPSSSGRPIPGFQYKIVDTNTDATLGPNQKGELRMKTKLQLTNYYNRDSSDIWDSNGWLKTGDIAYYDEDYCFYFVDRIKSLIKFQSWHVPPALLEGILQEHPAVKIAVVIGIPHDEDGEHPLGLVILQPNAVNITPEMLVEFVNARVDDRKKLRGGVMFITEIPYTPSGKVRRSILKENLLLKLKNKRN